MKKALLFLLACALVFAVPAFSSADVLETFDNDGMTNWYTYGSGNWGIAQDTQPDGTTGNVLQSTSWGDARALYSCGFDKDWTDYTFEADVKMNQGGDFAMAFHNKDYTGYNGQYYIQWFPNSIYFRYVTGNHWGSLASTYWNWQNGVWYHMKAVLSGANMKIYINNNLVFNITNSAYTTMGTVAFRTLNSVMSVDNVKITGVTGCTAPIAADLNINPDVINTKSHSSKNAVTAYIEIPDYDLSLIDINTVTLNTTAGTVSAQLSPHKIGDHDGDGIPDLMVKFNRQSVIDILGYYGSKNSTTKLTIRGTIGANEFTGSYSVIVR